MLAFLSRFFGGGYAADHTADQRIYRVALVSARLEVSVLAAFRLTRLLCGRWESRWRISI
jgi:hypothetical protein